MLTARTVRKIQHSTESSKDCFPKIRCEQFIIVTDNNIFEIAQTDYRLYAKAVLKCLPTGFFNTAETSALAKLGDTSAAFLAIKDKVFARYISHTDAATIRANLNNIHFDVQSGPSAYFSEIRQLAETALTVTGSDIVPLTILLKIMNEIPADVAEVLLVCDPLENRETAFQTLTFRDLAWMDDLQYQAVFLSMVLWIHGI